MSSERILIVEDDRAVGRSLEFALQGEGFAVNWAMTGQQALELVYSQPPQIILLDIRLPDINGFDICRQLRSAGMRQPILMLTARDEEMDRVLGLELGADDYIVKPYSLREVISRVRAHLRRAYGEFAAPLHDARLSFGSIELDLDGMQVFRNGARIDLTPIEFKLLRYLATNANLALTRDQIITAVWGYDGEVYSDRTVDAHIRHLREKLEDDPANPRWLLTVRGHGYKFAR